MGVYKNNNGNLQLISGATLYADAPVGSISAFGGSAAPSGWLLCQGQAVSRTTYAELFSVIGTAFGSGDGSTTFNIPDLRGEFLRGAGTNSHANQGNGGSVGEHQDATGIPNAYANNYSKVGLYLANKSTSDYNLLATNKDSTVTQSAAYLEAITSDKGDYTADAAIYTARPTNTSVNYIIKAQQVALPLDIQSEVEKKLDKKYLDTTGLDLDNCTESALYEINTSVANMPPGADGGNMIVSNNPSNGAVVQTYFATNGTIASRYRLGSNAWTDWNNRPPILYTKNVQYTSDSAGNIVLHNSIDNVVIVSIRTNINATWAMGYSPTAGCYIHLQDFNGNTLANTTVNLDIVYYSYDWTA